MKEIDMWKGRLMFYFTLAVIAFIGGWFLAPFGDMVPKLASIAAWIMILGIFIPNPVSLLLPYGTMGVLMGVLGLIFGGLGLTAALLTSPAVYAGWMVISAISVFINFSFVHHMLILWSGPKG